MGLLSVIDINCHLPFFLQWSCIRTLQSHRTRWILGLTSYRLPLVLQTSVAASQCRSADIPVSPSKGGVLSFNWSE